MNRKLVQLLFAGTLTSTAMVMCGCGAAGPPSVGSDTSTPATSAASETGDTASWELLEADQVTTESTTIQIGVTRISCASGITGTVLEPQIQVEATRIVIRALVETQKPGGYNCQSNNVVPITVKLPSSIGHHELFDAVCLDSHQLTTASCAYDQGIRWKP
jgi:hypothetical protein